MHIKPAPGRAVRHPGTMRLLALDGETVTPSPFWHRLLVNGDIEQVTDNAQSTSIEVIKNEDDDHAI